MIVLLWAATIVYILISDLEASVRMYEEQRIRELTLKIIEEEKAKK